MLTPIYMSRTTVYLGVNLEFQLKLAVLDTNHETIAKEAGDK